VFYDNIFLQILMGGAATITFLSAIGLVDEVTRFIKARRQKSQAEVEILLAGLVVLRDKNTKA